MLLETLVSFREELENAEKEVSELRGKIRMLESVREAGADTVLTQGICIRCGTKDSVLPPNVLASQQQSLNRITQ